MLWLSTVLPRPLPYRNAPGELATPIYIISDCIKELFMLVIALCTASFFQSYNQ